MLSVKLGLLMEVGENDLQPQNTVVVKKRQELHVRLHEIIAFLYIHPVSKCSCIRVYIQECNFKSECIGVVWSAPIIYVYILENCAHVPRNESV